MLKELHIRDFAIIDELHLNLEPGFNILTGETGAGKSIVIDAVMLLLGGRADATAIREGATRASVEGMFQLDAGQQARLAPLLEQEGLDSEAADVLWLSRELRDNGRSVARVNGSVVAAALLRQLGEQLVDIHGQSEHLSLLRVAEHVQLLDRFADLGELRERVAEAIRRLQAVRRELQALRQDESSRMQRQDLLRFQLQELTAAALQIGEEDELEAERVRLANAEQLASLTATLLTLLEEGAEESPAVLDLLGQGQREMAALVRVDPSLSSQESAWLEAVYQLEDLARSLREYLGRIEFNPRRLQQVEERLALIHSLRRKYGGDIPEILAYATRIAAELESLEHSDERIAGLEEAVAAYSAAAAELCGTLSAARRDAARRLAAGVEGELADLRMGGTRFGVAFRCEADPAGLPLETALPAEVWVTADAVEVQDAAPVSSAAFDLTGVEQVEFLIAPNVGEGLKPLARIASGGETARLMLALKTVLSRADRTPTLIFDEIDQGIGGRVGAIVGAKLWRLTRPTGAAAGDGQPAHQVLCITHLPQLAAFGDAHYGVQKAVVEGRTVTTVRRLEAAARVEELAQMLGTQGAASRQGAEELLAQAAAHKSGFADS
ncbi:MAG TPA: DNA repair protein RecN [Anaerolineae bacterium]|nr:DNA repair protein RecN [Anaerolineae bacterium]